MEWDDAEDMWRSDKENDMGYICPKCGQAPSFKDLRRGTCSTCRQDKLRDKPERV